MAAAAAEALRLENRWGTEMGKVLEGRFEFYPEGYNPPCSAEDSLKRLLFPRKPTPKEVFELADLKAKSLPDENRGHVMVVYSYTIESSLYKNLTSCMRRRESSGFVQWQPFIFHMERALRELPVVSGPVYRGLSLRLGSHIYQDKSIVTWQSFTSATCRVECVEPFLGREGNKRTGTVAIIESIGARDVRDFSHFGDDEGEVVFLPNTQFRVTGVALGKAIVTRLLPELDAYDLTDLKVLSLDELPPGTVPTPLVAAPVASTKKHVAAAATPSASPAASATDHGADPTKEVAWEWLNDSHAWQRFGNVDADKLETKYQSGIPMLITEFTFNPNCRYIVDFKKMVQFNEQSNKSRNIRRAEYHGSPNEDENPPQQKKEDIKFPRRRRITGVPLVCRAGKKSKDEEIRKAFHHMDARQHKRLVLEDLCSYMCDYLGFGLAEADSFLRRYGSEYGPAAAITLDGFRRGYPSMNPYHINERENEVIVRKPGSLNRNQLRLEELNNCDVYACDITGQVFADYLKGCCVLLGPCESSTFVRDCEDCIFWVAAQQLRTNNCRRCTFYLYSLTAPIIETSEDLAFAPWAARYPCCCDHFEALGFDPNQNLWNAIYDFSGEVNVCSWRILALDDVNELVVSLDDPQERCADPETPVPLVTHEMLTAPPLPGGFAGHGFETPQTRPELPRQPPQDFQGIPERHVVDTMGARPMGVTWQSGMVLPPPPEEEGGSDHRRAMFLGMARDRGGALVGAFS